MENNRIDNITKGFLGLELGLGAFIIYRLLSYFTALILKKTDFFSNSAVILIAGTVFTAAAVFIGVKFSGKKFFEYIGLRKVKFPPIAAAVMCGAALNILTVSAVKVLPVPEKWIEENEQSVGLLGGCPVWLTIAATYVIAPLAEEFIFRGLMFCGMRKGWNFAISSAITAVIFGIAHGNVLQGIYAALAGFAFAMIIELSNSLACAAAAHIAYNAGNILTSILLTLAGNAGTLIIGILFTAGSVILLFAERKTPA